ncbi:MAG: hypothetical protein J1F32_01120, partial [Erysipelotrichales bacterium]|nr:hypothetical protein [Erysipelotrichales bacterium]
MIKIRKSLKKILSTFFMFLTCTLCLSLIGCGSSSWNISADADSNVTAELVKNGDEFTLKISGNGQMKSWNNSVDVPWSDKSNKITKVDIGNGVLSVGARAFYKTSIKSIILPESINQVGYKALKDEVAIFAYSKDIAYEEEYEQIYLYSEYVPKSNDRYWQSDFSNGKDIFDNVEDLFSEEGKYWHYNKEGQAISWGNKIKILFIGNSFTYKNGVVEHSSGIPGIFDNIADNLGYWVETYSVTGPGWYLKNHAKATDACGKQVDKILKARNDFDYIVLQEQSLNPFVNYNDFLSGVKALKAKIEETQDHAQIILYETWGSPYSANEKKTTIPEMERWLREAYENAAEACGGLKISYVGKAFTDIYRHRPDIYLWDTDNRHQGYTGAYLSACVHVGTILGGDVRKTTFKGEAQYNAPNLSDEVYETLRSSAYNVVFGEIDENDPKPETHDYSLEVAIWGRWITESQFIELFDGFKKYGTANGLDIANIHYTYYVGATSSDPYFYIANFTSAVVAKGGADIVFPCATNLTTQDGTQITQATIEELNITLNGKSDRCVARLTDTELSNAFFNYCLSNEAKAILDPTYHPPIDEDVDQTKVLVVSCWGRFMKEDKFNELVEDFKKYCDENNVDYIEIIGRYYQGAVQGVDPYYLIADFTKKVKEDGNADIILPCADNIKTNQNNITVEDELIPIDVYGQKDRRVASLNQDDLTKEFLSYIQTDSAKAILS